MSPTILNVNDSEPNRYALTLVLRRAGYEVIEAGTGEEALERVADAPGAIDLVLLDINLPGISGLEVCRRLKADPHTGLIAVLQISATAVEVEDRVSGLDSGADAYLLQSVQPQELLATVRSLLRVRDLEVKLTEREREMGLIVANAPTVLSRFDRQFRCLYVSPAVQTTLGFSPEQLLGKSHRELGRPAQECEQWESALRQVFETGEERSFEFSTLLGTGSRWYLVRVVAERDTTGAMSTALAAMTEITEQRRAQEALREADRRKDEFLAVLAHELRNPLAPIRNASHILKLQRGLDASAQLALEMIERQVRHMVRLIDDLLNISRITRGKLELRPDRVLLATIIEQAVESSTPHIEASGHQLTISLPDEPILLNADALRLMQVFANLLNNAAKFTEPGGRICLTAERVGEEVRVTVSDTGIGIAAEHLPRLFEIFSQVGSTMGRSQSGLGIGLSLAKGLVRLHGGRISAQSEGVGRGSEFTVWLPILMEPMEFNATPPIDCPVICDKTIPV